MILAVEDARLIEIGKKKLFAQNFGLHQDYV